MSMATNAVRLASESAVPAGVRVAQTTRAPRCTGVDGGHIEQRRQHALQVALLCSTELRHHGEQDT